MPLLIDSSPDCIIARQGATPRGDDSATSSFSDIRGLRRLRTFVPGSTYGEDGSGAETGLLHRDLARHRVMVVMLIIWVVYENRRLVGLGIAGASRYPAAAAGRSGRRA